MSRPGDVIVTTKGNSTGRVAFVTKDLPPFVYSPHLSFWRSLKPEYLNPDFLRYWSRSHEFRDQLTGLANSTDMAPYLSLADQRRLRIVLPPALVQREIARTLSTLDDKIELNRRMNQTLEAMARAIFKSWFVDFDPAADDQPWPQRLGTIGELGTIGRESLSPADYPVEFFDHYSIPAFDEGKIPKAERGDGIKSNKFVVPSVAVLLSKLNPRIPRVWLPSISAEQRSICSTEFLVIVPMEIPDGEFLYSLFCSSEFMDRFATRTTGTSGSHQRVRPEDLLRMEVAVPFSKAREYYSATVGPLFGKMAQTLQESRVLAALRDTLLPKLLSGEIRVKQAERMVGEVV